MEALKEMKKKIIHTGPLGEVEVSPRQLIEFSDGLIGLPDQKHCALLDSPDGNYYWLQGVENSDFYVPMILIADWVKDYRLTLNEIEEESLGSPEDLLVFAIVNASADPITVNLLGPVIINKKTLKGVQIVNQEDYPIQFSVK